MNELWSQTAEKQNFPKLKQDIKTDVLIIGGGMAGVLCAYMLQQAGVSYVLAEAETIGNGITRNTTAKITVQHGLIYDKIIQKYGIEKANRYLKSNQVALEQYIKLCKQISCDFEQKDSFVYSVDSPQKIEKELHALQKLGVSAKYYRELPLPFSVAGAVCVPNQAQFNPLKFLYAIAKDLNIYEHTKVMELEGTTAVTHGSRIQADKIIVATHFPILNKHGGYFVKMYQHRSYVIGVENAQKVYGMYMDEAHTGLSFRNYENLLLIGGGAHRTGKKGGNWAELRGFAKKYYPKAQEKCHWATQDCMTLDGIPYIGAYSKNTNNLFVATGFNKWGMTSSMVSAMILCDMVQGKQNDCAEVFSPSRSLLQPQLAVNLMESAKGLLSLKTKRCPHLGCALKWNAQEHSWDCPCHGSRFTQDGQLINNPATDDL